MNRAGPWIVPASLYGALVMTGCMSDPPQPAEDSASFNEGRRMEAELRAVEARKTNLTLKEIVDADAELNRQRDAIAGNELPAEDQP